MAVNLSMIVVERSNKHQSVGHFLLKTMPTSAHDSDDSQIRKLSENTGIARETSEILVASDVIIRLIYMRFECKPREMVSRTLF